MYFEIQDLQKVHPQLKTQISLFSNFSEHIGQVVSSAFLEF
jgi:hypothetical protein